MRRFLVPLLLLPLAIAGCARTGGSAAPGDDPDAAFAERAADVAQSWRQSVGESWKTGFAPLDGLTTPPPAGAPDDLAQAWKSGWFRLAGTLPAGTASSGKVTFADGSSLDLPLTTAEDAYKALDQGDPPCPDGGTPQPDQTGPGGTVGHTATGQCTGLTVTGATLGETRLRTSRGEATVPAWLFTVEGQPNPVARVAVAQSAIVTPPSPKPVDGSIDGGLVSAQDVTAVDGRKIGYRLGVGACDTGIRPLVYQSDDVVVLGGAVKRSTGMCTEQLLLKPVEVTLDAPIGARVILDVSAGTPLRRS
jgi:hypothetical protein